MLVPMNVAKHLLNDIKPLQSTEVVKDILDLMEELKFTHLPVVEASNNYLGLIDEDDLLELEDDTSLLQAHQRLLKPYSIPLEADVFKAIQVIGTGQLSMLPVVNGSGEYKGYVCTRELLQDLGRQITFRESGSTLVIEIPTRDYQLSQIAHIVESEDALILGFLINEAEEMDTIEVTLKINQKDITRILKSLDRYNYKVTQVHHESIFDDTIDQRYEALMKYLNI
ncbi:MAG: CBS domain-containing protein [Owenweeksia sp.]